MKTTLIITGILLGGLLLFGAITGIYCVSTYNRASTLRTQYDAKVKANESVFDNTWKKITQSAQVTDAQKNALKEIFVSYAQARTGSGEGGSVMKWVQESVPNVDTSVYRNLQNIITGARDEWTANQVALVDISREYNTMLATFPSNIVLGAFGFAKIDPKIVTSTRTQKAFNSGKDDALLIFYVL